MEKDELNNVVDLLVIGGSAGSYSVLMELIPLIKNQITFPILIVLHRKNGAQTSIADIFSKKTNLQVFECEDKETLLPNNIYFAPADYHIMIEQDNSICLDYSEKINYSRPSIDIIFKSASKIYQSRLAAILLSGANHDGAKGLQYIHQNFGITIVQNPLTAEVENMPASAIKLFNPNYVANVAEMANLINNFNT
jgi:two-component system chemotaxis response regulator CheB